MRGCGVFRFGEHAFCPRDHLRRGTTHGEFQIARSGFQRHPVLMLQRFADTQNFLREVAGDEFDLLVGLAFHARSLAAVVVVVHVAAGTIRQDADARCASFFFDAAAKFAEVICGEIFFVHAADIVQPVVGHQRDLASVGGLNGKAIHLGIRRSGRSGES